MFLLFASVVEMGEEHKNDAREVFVRGVIHAYSGECEMQSSNVGCVDWYEYGDKLRAAFNEEVEAAKNKFTTVYLNEEGKVKGFLAYTVDPISGQIYYGQMVSDHDVQNTGIGNALYAHSLRKIIERFPGTYFNLMWMYARHNNTHANAIYKAHGFKLVERDQRRSDSNLGPNELINNPTYILYEKEFEGLGNLLEELKARSTTAE